MIYLIRPLFLNLKFLEIGMKFFCQNSTKKFATSIIKKLPKPGVVNPRPKKNFMRPKLGSQVSVFLIFWMIFLCFCQNAAQKVSNFGNFFPMRSRDQFGLATPDQNIH
jgi:hypothetical protein